MSLNLQDINRLWQTFLILYVGQVQLIPVWQEANFLRICELPTGRILCKLKFFLATVLFFYNPGWTIHD